MRSRGVPTPDAGSVPDPSPQLPPAVAALLGYQRAYQRSLDAPATRRFVLVVGTCFYLFHVVTAH